MKKKDGAWIPALSFIVFCVVLIFILLASGATWAIDVSPFKIIGDSTIYTRRITDTIFCIVGPTDTVALANISGVLKFSNDLITWTAVGSGGGGANADSIQDIPVVISSIQNGQVLSYLSALTRWQNITPYWSDADSIKGIPISAQAPSNLQILKYSSDSSVWYPSVDQTGAGGAGLVVEEDSTVQLNATDTISFDGGLDVSASADGRVKVRISPGTGIQIASDSSLETTLGTAITTGEITDSTIAGADIAVDAIEAEHIKDGEVGEDEIATDAVHTAEIANGTIQSVDIGTAQVTASHIASNAVANDEMADNAIGTAELQSQAVTAAKIANNTITPTQLASNSVEADEIAANAVGNSEMADNAIGNLELRDTCVTTTEILDGTVALVDMADDAVDSSVLAINDDPTDGEVLGWNTAGGYMEWISNAAGAETDPTLTDDNAVTIGDGTTADPVLTFDASTGTDGTITYDESGDDWLFDGNSLILTGTGGLITYDGPIVLDSNADDANVYVFFRTTDYIMHQPSVNKFYISDSADIDGNLDVDDTVRATTGIFSTNVHASGDLFVTDDIFCDSIDADNVFGDTVKTNRLVIGSDIITDITGTNLSITGGVLNASGAGGGTWVESNDSATAYVNDNNADTICTIYDDPDSTIMTAGDNTVLLLREDEVIIDGGDTTILEGQARMDTVSIDDYLNVEGGLQIGGYGMTIVDGSDGQVLTYDATNDSTYWSDAASGSIDSGIIDVGGGTFKNTVTKAWKMRFADGVSITTPTDSANIDTFTVYADLGTAITSDEITDGEIVAADIATDGVGAAEIAANAVGSSELADNAVDIGAIATGAVASDEILNQAIKGDDIDSTAENFVFDDAYHVTSAEADSAYITANTLNDTGDVLRAEFNDSAKAQLENAVTGNTETGIAVTYQSADTTLDFVITAVSGLTIDGNNAIVVKPGTGLDTTGGTILHSAHTGDVTGATELTIAANAVESTMVGADQINDLDINFGTSTDQVSASDMPNEDIGDISISSGSYTLDANVVESTNIAPDQVNDLDINFGTSTDQVSPADFANEDIGDISISSGSWTLDNSVVDAPNLIVASKFEFDGGAYKGDTNTADSQYVTKDYVDNNLTITGAADFDIHGDAKVAGQFLEYNYIRGLDTSMMYTHTAQQLGNDWIRGFNSHVLRNLGSDTTGGAGPRDIDTCDFWQMTHPSIKYVAQGYGPSVGDSIYDDMAVKIFWDNSGTAYGDTSECTGACDSVSYDSLLSSDDGAAVITGVKWNYFAAYTPLPDGGDLQEDITVRVSASGEDDDWHVPCVQCTTTINSTFDSLYICAPDPVMDTADLNFSIGSVGLETDSNFVFLHLADPELIFDENQNLYAIYYAPCSLRYAGDASWHYVNFITSIYSNNGVNWNPADTHHLVVENRSANKAPLCPMITLDTSGVYKLWCVSIQSGDIKFGDMLYYTGDSLNVAFTFRDTIDKTHHYGYGGWGTFPRHDITPWHGWIGRRGSEYDCFMHFSDSGTAGTGNDSTSGIYYGRSIDGLKWEWITTPIFRGQQFYLDSVGLYRPTALWEDDGRGGCYRIWYGIYGQGSLHHIAHTRVKFNDNGYAPLTLTPIGGAGSAGPGDSVRLELPSHESNALLMFKDSSIAGGAGPQTDSVWLSGRMPRWADFVDSLIIIIKGKSATGDSAEVSKMEIFGLDRSTPSLVPDSSYWNSTTARNTASIARYAYYVGNADINAGEQFSVLMETTLGANVNGVVYVYDVYCIVSEE